THNVRYAYMTGAMANGIASEELVIAMGRDRLLGSFGAAGLSLKRIDQAIHTIQQALPDGPYAFNLIHTPHDMDRERRLVDRYVQRGVTTVEASAFMNLTANLVYYRAVGLEVTSDQQIERKHRIIAKLSRPEVAQQFLQPAPDKILKTLVTQGRITETQAKLAAQVPMADDITVEADSGGHTDNQPLVCLLPSMLALRDEIQTQFAYATPVLVGAAGGISTPQSALAAFMMGAAYVVTGSVNQACVEANTSDAVKALLAEAAIADVTMAPSADMFEMGVKVQVLKRGTMFGVRSQRLLDVYRTYESLENIPPMIQKVLETQIFKMSMEQLWQETVVYLRQNHPAQLQKAMDNPKRKMALMFRWYLGRSSRWAKTGDNSRTMDYQIWCGPAIGAFNAWVKDSYLATPENRQATDIAHHMMMGAAYLYRLHLLKLRGVNLPAPYWRYQPRR
ncbi:MAG: PfaD family polyunsaturated fatty acid/polyketide biosynthesis protein, partial [Cyanobacteria bacterium P01_F01_bin.150]